MTVPCVVVLSAPLGDTWPPHHLNASSVPCSTMSQRVSLLALQLDYVALAVNAILQESVTLGNADLMPTATCPSSSTAGQRPDKRLRRLRANAATKACLFYTSDAA